MSAVPHPAEEPSQQGHWDWWLLGTTVLLAGFGLLMVLSASSVEADAHYGNAFRYVSRQAAGLLIGVAGSLLVLRAPWPWLRRAAWPAYFGSVFLLSLVLSPLGNDGGGAVRWLDLGPINVQPSEIAKLALVLALAHFLAANEGRIRDLVGTVLPAVGLALVPVLLVFLEPDFGTTVILCGLLGVSLYVAGLQWRWLALGGALGASVLGSLALLAPYRVKRLTSFLEPYADPSDAGYQVVQGWIAMAHGGWLGQGIGSGVAQRGFLPEAHTDYIAAVIGEELGAVGWLLAVVAQAVIVWRGTVIADRAPDLFGTLLASGITALLASQALVNLGVVAGWLPNKGLVLPFLSYGASAAVVHTVCIGLLLRVGLEQRPRRP